MDLDKMTTAEIAALLGPMAERERQEVALLMLERWQAAREGRLH